jgi:hypothetical protein
MQDLKDGNNYEISTCRQYDNRFSLATALKQELLITRRRMTIFFSVYSSKGF